jgi:hypothetical protein
MKTLVWLFGISLIVGGCSTAPPKSPAENIEIKSRDSSLQSVEGETLTNSASSGSRSLTVPSTVGEQSESNATTNPGWFGNLKGRFTRDLYAPPTYKTDSYYKDLTIAAAPDLQLEQLKQKLINDKTYQAFSDPNFPLIEQQIDLDLQQKRDVFVYKYAEIISYNFDQYVRFVTEGRASLDTTADMVVLGLNGAAAAIASSGTKTILNIASSAFIGSKASLDKNFFMEKTTIILAIAMENQRRVQLAYMRDQLKQSLTNYTLYMAAGDLENLYSCGTMTTAFEQIAGQAQVATTGAAQASTTNSTPTFSTQPPSTPITVSHLPGSTITVTAVAEGTNIQYQWQFSSNAIEWKNCDGVPFSNSTSSTMTITAPASSMNGTMLRCVATNKSTNAIGNSTVVVLIVN